MTTFRKTIPMLALVAVLIAASVWLGGCGGSSSDATGLMQSAAVSAAALPTDTPPPTGTPPPLNGQIKSLKLASGVLASFVLVPPPPPQGQPPKPSLTIKVTSTTTYTAGTETVTADKLKAGLPVAVTLADKPTDNVATATVVNILPPVVNGKIKKVTLAAGSLKSFILTADAPPGQAAPADATITVTATTKYLAGATELTAKALKAGLKVEVVLQSPLTKKNTGVAIAVRLLPPTAGGLVKSVTLSSGALASFVLTPPVKPGATAPADLTIAVTATTKYVAGPNATATSSDVKVGAAVEAVLLAPPANNAATAAEVRILPPPPAR